MRYLVVSLCIILCSSCTSQELPTILVDVTDNGSTFNDSHLLYVLNMEYIWTQEVQPFVVEVTVTFTPVLDVTSEDTFFETVVLPIRTDIVEVHWTEFVDCQGIFVYGRGHRVDQVTEAETQKYYTRRSFEYIIKPL